MSKNTNTEPLRMIISGGGTGGHIFPAIAIADAVRRLSPGAEVLFVGALGRMEMEKVPKAGYNIEGLWISGFRRQLSLDNLAFPFKLLSSMWKAGRIIRRFRPQVVVGTGGFASGPVLQVASRRRVPTLIQEQNAYAGVTNKLLAKQVNRVCVAYPGMEKYFPAEKLLLTGNPIREEVIRTQTSPEEARAHYGLRPDLPTLLITGGSLGARTLNRTVAENADWLQAQTDVQLLWQCGKLYYDEYSRSAAAQLPNVKIVAFLDRMDLAYAAADVVACRAGALTLAELSLLGKAAVLVPSPNVAEDHQTKNARALADRSAAVLVTDARAVEELLPTAVDLLRDANRREELGNNVRTLAQPNAAQRIAEEILKLVRISSPIKATDQD